MANLKNKKTSVAKDAKAVSTTKAAPVAAAQSAVAAKAEDTKVVAKETATAVKEAPEKKAEKPVAKKTTAKKTTEKKAATKKATKKAAVKEVVEEVFFEYNGEQILSKELVERIKETWKNEGHRIGSIKSLRVYINPEERKAYYVINDKADGKFVEF